MTFTEMSLFNHHTVDNAASSMANYSMYLPLRSKGSIKVKRLSVQIYIHFTVLSIHRPEFDQITATSFWSINQV